MSLVAGMTCWNCHANLLKILCFHSCKSNCLVIMREQVLPLDSGRSSPTAEGMPVCF